MKLRVSLGAALSLLWATAAAAAVNGAIFTTTQDGTAVNANIYQAPEHVYLNGGPRRAHAGGLSPDGVYYFQVTDPSGAALLSTDDVSCRVVLVASGRVQGVPAGSPDCSHATGVFNVQNGSMPVQLAPFSPTPNNGGEYKLWVTPVSEYDSCPAAQSTFGFCAAASKTDNFKVRSAAPTAAFVWTCVFNDFDANGVQDPGEPLLAHWPVTATGVEAGTVTAQTDDEGCVSFSVTSFTGDVQTVTLTAGTFGPDWSATSPVECVTLSGCAVGAGVVTLLINRGDEVHAPDFGFFNPYCVDGCSASELVLTTTAYTSAKRTFAWDIAKQVDRVRIESASTEAVANYTVTVTPDAGTDSDWKATGTIRVANPSAAQVSDVVVTAAVEGLTACTVTGGQSAQIAAGSHEDFPYGCELTAPVAGLLTAQAAWSAGTASAGATLDFDNAVVTLIDDAVTIDDTLAGNLGTAGAADAMATTFQYALTLDGTPGTCVVTANTASYTAGTTGATGSSDASVTLCVGADLSVSQDTQATAVSAIAKTARAAVVQQPGGSTPIEYSVTVTQSGWVVAGAIHVFNPNDWQAVAVTVSDAADQGGSCVLTAGSTSVVPAGGTVALPYSCSYATAPALAAGTHSATVAWDAGVFSTPSALAATTAGYGFAPVQIVDAFNGEASEVLGFIAAPAAATTYAYSRTAQTAAGGACRGYTNVASIVGGASASATVQLCNPLTGAHTIGFWQNKNGQGIVTGGAAVAGVCSAGAWLRTFTPFQDLAANASCRTVSSYVASVIKAANASGASMNAMLKAQMLATALDVYFSVGGLGGNQIGAAANIGAVRVDLRHAAAAFGGASSLTVLELLTHQNGVATPGGAVWYGNSKTVQGLAKNVFDAINSQAAAIAP